MERLVIQTIDLRAQISRINKELMEAKIEIVKLRQENKALINENKELKELIENKKNINKPSHDKNKKVKLSNNNHLLV